MTIGTFDLLHRGHRRLFERARMFGKLTVGVNTDRFVLAYRGQHASQTEAARASSVWLQRTVEKVVMNDSAGIELIREHMPDLLVIGSDWLDRNYVDQLGTSGDELAKLGISVIFIPRTPGISSTDLRAK